MVIFWNIVGYLVMGVVTLVIGIKLWEPKLEYVFTKGKPLSTNDRIDVGLYIALWPFALGWTIMVVAARFTRYLIKVILVLTAKKEGK